MSLLRADASLDTLTHAVEDNMAAQFAYFGRSPLAEVVESPELLRYASGIPIPEYNGVIHARFAAELAPDALAGRIASVVAYFAAHHLGFSWWLGPSCTPANLSGLLMAAGLAHLGDGPGMAAVLDALDDSKPEPPGVAIAPVRDEQTLRDWTEVAGAGYGEPESVREARYEVHRGLGLGSELPLQRYVAYLDDRPVAMSALFLGAGVAGIYEVATARDERRRGFGAAITRAPLLHARALGYHVGVLQASEMGASVYARLGFRQVCTFSLYAWEPRTS